MAKWTAFPHDSSDYTYDAAALKKKWTRLHGGDAEPLPTDAKVLAAWSLFHAGEFQKAYDAGLKAGGAARIVSAASPREQTAPPSPGRLPGARPRSRAN